MHIICLAPLEPGVYNDHKSDNIIIPPDGWAYIPDDIKLPSTFPRLGSITAENVTYTRNRETEDDNHINEEYTMMTVTSMTEGDMPEPVEPEPSTESILLELAADHEARLCEIELGV